MFFGARLQSGTAAAALPFERLWAALQTRVCAVAVLRCGVSAGRRPLAALVFQRDLAKDGERARVPPSTELSASPTGPWAAGSRASCRRGVRPDRVRGWAPSRSCRKICLCPSGLLRAVRSRTAIASATLLFVPMPQGFTSRLTARGAVGTAA